MAKDMRRPQRPVGQLGSDCWSLSSRWLPDASFDQIDQPPQGATHVSLAVASRENGVGVVMGGEGADEWMTGHPSVGDALAAWKPPASREACAEAEATAASLCLRCLSRPRPARCPPVGAASPRQGRLVLAIRAGPRQWDGLAGSEAPPHGSTPPPLGMNGAPIARLPAPSLAGATGTRSRPTRST